MSPDTFQHPAWAGAGPVPGAHLFAGRAQQRSLSVAEARDYLGRLLVPHRLSVHGHARSMHLHHTMARIGRLNLHFIDYRSQADTVEVQVPRLGRNYFLQFPLNGHAEISQGGRSSVKVTPGMVFVGQPDLPLVSAMSQDYRQLMLEVPRDVLLAMPGRPRSERPDRPLHFDIDTIHRNPAPRLLLDTLGTLCQALAASDRTITQTAVQRAFQETLAALVLTLPQNLTDVVPDQTSNGPVPYYVRRAEAYMRAHLTDEVGIDDLVRVAAVSRRSLHAGFRRFRATTPLGLFKTMRLEAAREALLRGSEEPVTVTGVATTYGFFHLSKFARDFREAFGELPSEMLQRAGR